jgi:SOS-response transcriptional repressor LexA
MGWFAEFLNREYSRRFPGKEHGSLKRFAHLCGYEPTSVGRWLDAISDPGSDTVADVVKKLGGDIGRALPDYTPEALQPVVVWGRVSAGTVRWADQDGVAHDTLLDVFEHHPFRRYTEGQIIYLSVDGNSMEPDYPDGSLIACARAASSNLPDMTPVVARAKHHEATFKLYLDAGEEVVLLPLNYREHRPQRYRKHVVIIDYIVLGHIAPHTTSSYASMRR